MTKLQGKNERNAEKSHLTPTVNIDILRVDVRAVGGAVVRLAMPVGELPLVGAMLVVAIFAQLVRLLVVTGVISALALLQLAGMRALVDLDRIRPVEVLIHADVVMIVNNVTVVDLEFHDCPRWRNLEFKKNEQRNELSGG